VSRAVQPVSTEPPTGEAARYGESVVREILGASFIEEQPVVPRVMPLAGDF
jgi:DNA polymerase-3 subunit gamma/tau